MAKTATSSDAVYFLSLSLENVRCFGSRQTLDLSDGNGRPARWERAKIGRNIGVGIAFDLGDLREDGLPIPAASTVVEYCELAA
jgi:hypothetical protein